VVGNKRSRVGETRIVYAQRLSALGELRKGRIHGGCGVQRRRNDQFFNSMITGWPPGVAMIAWNDRRAPRRTSAQHFWMSTLSE
jgi:hypothetical protein